MKQKLLFKAPVLTASGYGVHARQILAGLIKSDHYDISVKSLSWGNTSMLHEDSEFFNATRSLCKKYDDEQAQQDKPQYDVSVQVTIPNEFEKCAKVNIGITAGIEVDTVSPDWLVKANNEVDVLIVPSQHSKNVFENTVYRDQNGKELKLNKPAFLAHEGFDPTFYNADPLGTPSQFSTTFNFLFVGLGIGNAGQERKNTSNLIKWFCEVFKGRKDVGLVLKTGLVNNSLMDFEHTKAKIAEIKTASGCGKFPQIHLVHGRLSDKEMSELYKDTNVKCFAALTHGEGFGLPLLEAAACGLPIMATNWSGHLDFLNIPGVNKSFVDLGFDLAEVPESAVWKGVIESGTKWANVREDDVKSKMKKIVASYDKPKEWATNLANFVKENFVEEVVMGKLVSDIKNLTDRIEVENPSSSTNPEDLANSIFTEGDEGKRLLYTMPMSAGDVYISTAVVDSLKKKYPDHKIFFATKPQYSSILKDNPNIHKVIDWHEWMMNVPLLEQTFDEVYTPNLTVQMTFSNWVHGGRGRKLGDELANACIVPFGDYHIECEEPAESIAGEYIVLHPGSGEGQWEARNYTHWQEVVSNLKRELGKIDIVQVGLKDDPLYDGCVDYRGKTENYNQLAHVVKSAKLVLGIDSVSTHLAAGLETPHISLFGSSYASSTGPVVKNNSLSVLLETPDRRGCDKACYKYECKVEKEYPCINEISPKDVYGNVLAALNGELGDATEERYEEYNPKISGYTHVFNAEAGEYPFVQSIKSMLGFCDEVIVVDGGSDDGTVQKIEAIDDSRIKVVERKWDWDEPGMDGMQKAYGRAMCTGDFLWQQDSDEVVHEEDYDKVRKLVKKFPKQAELMHLPVVELWGDSKTVRTDRHSWKWRLSRNNFRITHGIAAQARLVDEETGKVYSKKGQSDGCEFIDIMTHEYIPHCGFYNGQLEQTRNTNPQEYGTIMNEVFKQLPSVYHYSWANIPRKIKNFKQTWNSMWNNLYRDAAPEDRFPQVKDEHDNENIEVIAKELKDRGGEHGQAETFQLTKEQPALMKDW